MKEAFLGWTPGGDPIRVPFDCEVSRLVDAGPLKFVIPKTAVIGFGWRSGYHPSSQTFYVFRDSYKDGRKTSEYLHRFLTGLTPGDGLDVHHRNGCGLDCSGANMQILTKPDHASLTANPIAARENLEKAHRARHAQNKVGVYGVYKHHRRPGFFAQAKIKGQRTQYLGKFLTVQEASSAVADYLRQFDPADWRIARSITV